MNEIVSESDWHNCTCLPTLLFHNYRNHHPFRFRFLLLSWINRISKHFTPLQHHWFRQFAEWANQGGEYPCFPSGLPDCPEPRSDDSGVESSRRSLFESLRSQKILYALSYAHCLLEFNRMGMRKHRCPHVTIEMFQDNELIARYFRESTLESRKCGYRETRRSLRIRNRLCSEFRDVAGNPFRPLTFNPAWRTSPVLELAQTIDREQKYDLMPILADVLEETGCTNADILSHCRIDKSHVKNCWVVDLAMGVIDSLHAKQ
jgi:hypothetical protein